MLGAGGLHGLFQPSRDPARSPKRGGSGRQSPRRETSWGGSSARARRCSPPLRPSCQPALPTLAHDHGTFWIRRGDKERKLQNQKKSRGRRNGTRFGEITWKARGRAAGTRPCGIGHRSVGDQRDPIRSGQVRSAQIIPAPPTAEGGAEPRLPSTNPVRAGDARPCLETPAVVPSSHPQPGKSCGSCRQPRPDLEEAPEHPGAPGSSCCPSCSPGAPREQRRARGRGSLAGGTCPDTCAKRLLPAGSFPRGPT